jgi:lipopolysaccharide biosynthesis glycosyltransferase
MEKNEIVIVCAADNQFADALTVMIYSVLKTSSSKNIKLYVLDGGISLLAKNRISTLVNKRGNRIKFLKMDENMFKGYLVSERLTQAIYYRLLIPDLLLGENVQKAIYLDCDLMLNADISELWNVELGRNVLAAVAETNEGCRYVSSPRALRLYKELGIPEKNKYFNSGVLVMNLEEWRKRNITAKVCNYLTENREQVIYHDQDGLNAILWDSWLELPTDWNVMSYLFITEHKHQVINMEKETVEQLRRNPKIVHFTGWKKPWIEEYVHPYASLYRKYAQEVGKICVREE